MQEQFFVRHPASDGFQRQPILLIDFVSSRRLVAWLTPNRLGNKDGLAR